MNKKANTLLFTILSTIVNIIMTLLIILVLCVLSFLIMNYLCKCKNGQVYAIVWMFCFLGGMVLGMFLFVRLCGWVLTKFHLESKMDPRMLGKYLPGGKRTEVVEEEPKQQTVMPSSVLPKRDKWGEDTDEELQQPPTAPKTDNTYSDVYPPTIDKKD